MSGGGSRAGRVLELVDERFEQQDHQEMRQDVSSGGALVAAGRSLQADQALEALEATRVAGNRVDMTRPLCVYPQIATYKGAGSTNDAANFVCK